MVNAIHQRGMNQEDISHSYEVSAIKRDQSFVWLEIRVTPLREEFQIIGTQFILRDITERKKAEQEKFRLAELNRKIIEASDELFYVLQIINLNSLKNPVLFISPQVNVIMGIHESQLIGETNRWLDFVHPEDLGRLNKAINDLFQYRKPVQVRYRIFNQILNEYLWVEDYSSPYFNEYGEMIEIYGSLKDVTAQVLADQKIQEEQKYTLAYQYQLLCSQLNPHFLYNTLNSFQYYILSGKIEESLNYISAFSGLMRSVLDNSTYKFIRLDDEISFIEQYVGISKLRMSRDLDFSIKIGRDLDSSNQCIPPMLLQPYIENALLHAFHPEVTAPMLEIGFEKKGSRIICKVLDNGVGRQFTLQKNEQKPVKKSHAMRINQSRIDLLNQIHSKNYELAIRDLTYESGKARGTEVIISFDEIKDESGERW